MSCVVALGLTGCAPSESNDAAAILLFKGTGTSLNDVRAVEAILKGRGLAYHAVDSRELNRMSVSQLAAHRLLIIPGGNYIRMGNSLTPEATRNIRNSVEGGLNYLGICAGGLLAGNASCNSLNLTSGVRFGFYAEVNRGVHKAAVMVTGAGRPALEQYWEDGPQFAGWGSVVGKYPDGTPAVVEAACGKGWVILCGVHPEAPENWRRRGMGFTTSATDAHAFAATLVDAALQGTTLPHY